MLDSANLLQYIAMVIENDGSATPGLSVSGTGRGEWRYTERVTDDSVGGRGS